ncbi:MAG: G5 domain-containing protein [Clostridia bacterium]|nr:G5 domain-containing protein [Clostridia bacterium]
MFQKNSNENKPTVAENKANKIFRVFLVVVLCLLSVASAVMLQNSIKTYRIADGEISYVYRTINGDLPQALSNTDLKSDQYRIVSSSTDADVTSVEIEYVFPVYVTVANETKEYLTAGGTVAEVLTEAGYTVDEFDLVQPAADAKISETTYIDYTNIDYKDVKETEAIAHKTVTVNNKNLEKGKKKVTEGKDGVLEITYKVKYVNGAETDRTETAKTVVTPAVDTKCEVGTKVKTVAKKTAQTTTVNANAKPYTPNKNLSVKQRVLAVVGNVKIAYKNGAKAVSKLLPRETIELDANNRPLKYSKKVTVQATAYTHTGHNCSTGVKPTPGYIAVNPKIIPYGTKMFIVSKTGNIIYGYAVAADTGGFAKSRPTNVDLFYDTLAECRQFGRRDVDIYFLP